VAGAALPKRDWPRTTILAATDALSRPERRSATVEVVLGAGAVVRFPWHSSGGPRLHRGWYEGNGERMERALQDVRILDIYENASSARVDAGDWVDFLHLAKWNGRWVIVNVLWEMRPALQAP